LGQRRRGFIAVVVLAGLVAGCEVPKPSERPRAVAPDQSRSDDLLRQNETRASEPELAEAYDTINARYFDSRLPPVRIRWEEQLEEIGALIADGFRLEGLTNGKVILLHPRLEDDARQFKAVLCHEMVHVDLRGRPAAHGPEFQARLRELADRGAFEGIVATDEEKQALKETVDRRSNRLSYELSELRQQRSRLETDAPSLSPEVLQDRTWEFNRRVRRHNEDAEAFNRMVEQYNLMITYPDGLDRERLTRRPTVADAK